MRCAFLCLLAISSLGQGLTVPSLDFEEGHISHPQTVPPSQVSGENKSLADAPNWTVRSVRRRIPSNDRIWLGFHITSEGYDPEWCYMLIHVQGDPVTAPFTNEPCVGSGFTVSWGYMAENEGGIMTLLNPQGTRSSWFGWNHVNSAEHLNDVGPNPTRDVSE